MLGAAGKVRAGLWNLCSPLPGRLGGIVPELNWICVCTGWCTQSPEPCGNGCTSLLRRAGAALGSGAWLELMCSGDCAALPAPSWNNAEASLRCLQELIIAAPCWVGCCGWRPAGLGRKWVVLLRSCPELRKSRNLRHLHHPEWKMCYLERSDPSWLRSEGNNELGFF